jgi:hypothetical protein
MKKLLLSVILFLVCGVNSSAAGWLTSANTNEVAFATTTVNAYTLAAIPGSETNCYMWHIWEGSGTMGLTIVTDGGSTTPCAKGNTLSAVHEKPVWNGAVYSSRLNRQKIWVRGTTGTAQYYYSAEAE